MAENRELAVVLKKCKECRREKSSRDFPCHNKAHDGLGSRCLECKRGRKVGPLGDFVKCTECHAIKSVVEFYRRARKANGVRSACKLCSDRRKDAWYSSTLKARRRAERCYRNRNRERLLLLAKDYHRQHAGQRSAYMRLFKSRRPTYWADWLRKNRWRARLQRQKRRAFERAAPGKFTLLDVADLLQIQKGLCAYCCEPLTETFQIDHIIPISKGGTNYPNNIACACRTCNRLKGDRLDWVPVLDCFRKMGLVNG